MNKTNVSRVIELGTEKTIAVEIECNDGTTFFVAQNLEGMRVGSFPNDKHGAPLERILIARLEPTK